MTELRKRSLILALATPYLTALALIAFWPKRIDGELPSLLNFAMNFLTGPIGLGDKTAYNLLEGGTNVVLFVPFGIIAALLTARFRLLWSLGAALLVSGMIELGQQLFRPERVASLQDVALNTFGSLLGGLLILLMRWHSDPVPA